MRLKKLPRPWKQKPSRLIKLAIRDNIACVKDDKFTINMETWVLPSKKGACEVCFAGGIMAKTLQCPMDKLTYPSDFDEDTCLMLNAIDFFRCGEIASGLKILDLEMPFGLMSEIQVTEYEDDPKQFRRDMMNLAETLEKLGL